MIVLDASFLVKLVLEEDNSKEARSLAKSWAVNGETLATIDLALPEALNAIWKHAMKIHDLDIREALDSAEDLLKIWPKLRVYQSKEIAGKAFILALKENITVYEALYIQLAKTIRATIATFDEKLSRIAGKHNIPTHP